MTPDIRTMLWISKVNYLSLILILIFICLILTTFKRLSNKSIYILGEADLILIN